MNATKLTNWKVDPRDPFSVLIDSYYDSILQCGGQVGIRCHSPQQAKIVASAPEMLHELQSTLTTLQGCFQTVNVMNRIKSIRKLIAKATA